MYSCGGFFFTELHILKSANQPYNRYSHNRSQPCAVFLSRLRVERKCQKCLRAVMLRFIWHKAGTKSG
jgi:hypothetical protein